MWREVRRVPANWQHPKRISKYRWTEEYQPCRQRSLKEAIKDYYTDLKKWYKDYFDFVENGKTVKYERKTYSFKIGNFLDRIWDEPPSPPDPKYYMPEWERFQLFEDVSEWTPLSPAFETAEELVDWLCNNLDYRWTQRTREQAEWIVKHWSVCSWAFIWWKHYSSNELAGLN